jgi:hypothetical protein
MRHTGRVDETIADEHLATVFAHYDVEEPSKLVATLGGDTGTCLVVIDGGDDPMAIARVYSRRSGLLGPAMMVGSHVAMANGGFVEWDGPDDLRREIEREVDLIRARQFRFIAPEDWDGSQPVRPATTRDLLASLHAADAEREVQQATVDRWLAEHEPTPLLRWSLARDGFVDRGSRGNALLAPHELETLDDARLVELIQERSSIDADRAAEALAILRGNRPRVEGDTVIWP